MALPKTYPCIIPKKAVRDKRLRAGAKLLLGDIHGSISATGSLYVSSNSQIASKMRRHPRTIGHWLSELESAGYIRVVIDKASGNSRVIEVV